MKKKYIRPNRIHNGPVIRSFKKASNCRVHFKNGKIYLVEYPGYQEYYKDKKLHRLDGPAIEYESGGKYWYLNGQEILVKTQEEFERYLNTIAFR